EPDGAEAARKDRSVTSDQDSRPLGLRLESSADPKPPAAIDHAPRPPIRNPRVAFGERPHFRVLRWDDDVPIAVDPAVHAGPFAVASHLAILAELHTGLDHGEAILEGGGCLPLRLDHHATGAVDVTGESPASDPGAPLARAAGPVELRLDDDAAQGIDQ